MYVRLRRQFLIAVVAAAILAVCAAGAGHQARAQVQTIIPPAPATGGETQRVTPQPVRPGTPVIEEIVVQGSQRIETETVLSYLSVKEGDPFDPSAINQSLKTLFSTGLFADVTMRQEGNALVVRIVENPIINRIAFEGNKRIKDEALDAEVQLRPRVVYTRTRVQSDVRRILDVYRRSGRFAATVEPKVIQLEQNRVDLVFEISEGPVTDIEKISFIGNKYFSDSDLRSVVATKESAWYRFLSSADTYDPDRLTFDRELLRRHYLANGFVDFRVVSAVAELSEDRESFFITITVEEGERFKFGTFNVVSQIVDVEAEPLKEFIELETGEYYDADAVDDAILRLTDAVGEQGYAFVDVRPLAERDRENLVIDLTFQIGEAPKVYVERIDIRGNVRTLDRVIRREFQLVEGDAFNSSRLRRSRDRLRALGFFSNVDVNNVPGTTPDKTVIEVDVTEQSTGEITLGAGFSSTTGALGEIGIRERNLLGKGQDLNLRLIVAQEESGLDLSFTEPYFLDKELSGGFDLFHRVRDNQDESSFDLQETGGALRVGYDINDDWRQGVFYRLSRQDIQDVDANASRIIRDQEGVSTRSIIGQTLTYDKRNSRVDPTDGFIVALGTDFAGLGGDVTYGKTTLEGTLYHQFSDDILASINGEVGYIVGIGDDVRINDRFFLGGDSLRGFENAGVGPRDLATDDSLGGQQMARGSVEVLFPVGLPEEFGIKGAVFSDFGTLTEIDDTGASLVDTGSIRASVGVGVNWVSPFGPIRVDFTQALVKEDHDETEFFRFSFGTRF
ncbi:outer membrane protein assembly factor BamA [Hwanghaeella grinnelliae]|uniref:outer membrane protein assembly factor BamA n=1 Tax=Hwanghaeella grinnelliae TaxID=2500179 RepID=UPI001F0147A4|nr:outer membrane protein assembly factor BamA [Hwanghaeella grinnelliae]